MVIMEGFLSKYTNVVGGWKKRYFILDNGVLSYSKQKNKVAKNSYDLTNAVVVPDKKNPRQFLVDIKGIKVKLRGYSIEEAEAWTHAICQLTSAININRLTTQEVQEIQESNRVTIFGIDDYKPTAVTARIDKLGNLHNAMLDELKKFKLDLETQNKTDILFAIADEFKVMSI